MSEKDILHHNYNTRLRNKKNNYDKIKPLYSKFSRDLRTNTNKIKDTEKFKMLIDSYIIKNHEKNLKNITELTKSKKHKIIKKKNNLSEVNQIKITISNLDSIVNLDSDEDSDYVPDKLDELPNDINYTIDEHKYIDSLDDIERRNLIEKEYKLLELNKSQKPIRFKILELKNLSINCKNNILEKVDRFYTLEPTDNEYSKLNCWLQWLQKIPFDKIHSLPVSSNSSEKDIYLFLKDTKTILDNSVYGHETAKEQILTTLAQIITNSDTKGRCIAIQGPMGNGKTTLVKHGICKALKRPFAFTALGGTQDSSFMLGHDYTYEGSKPGRIVEMLTEAQCMNPVLYFDELDKISDSSKGEEIENLLCHLTDFSQNTDFQDKYLSGINIDLSKIIFIFSYNDESKINPILLDRMFKIKTKGFNISDKIKITNQFLIPDLLKEFGMKENNISINNDTVRYIVDNYTENEQGVRNLRRNLSDIISKVNILNLINNENKDKESKIVSFDIKDFKLPLEITNDIVNKFLGIKEIDTSLLGLYS